MSKVIVGKSARTYSAILGSRTGMVIRSVIARQRREGSYDGARAAWTSATLRFWDIVDGQMGENAHPMRLENKIASQQPVKKASFLYSTKFGSRNGAVVSSVTAKRILESDNK